MVILLPIVRVIDSQFTPHEFVIVEIPHCCSGLICVLVFCEAEAFGFAGLFVVDEAEVVDLANAFEGRRYDFFGNAFVFCQFPPENKVTRSNKVKGLCSP